MAKQTFMMALRDGSKQEVAYHALIVIAGTQTHKLALHRTHTGDWAVSDPKTGAAVIRSLRGWYKGCPVSSVPFTLREMYQTAQEQVDDLIARIGSDRFNAVLANPNPF